MYFNTDKQCYEAFGLSAYYADMAASPELSFSHELQMPKATFSRQDVLYFYTFRGTVGRREQWDGFLFHGE